MRSLKTKISKTPLLTLTRSRQWTDKMVYILAANKSFRYKNGRSRVLYIGTTKKGGNRPAASAVNKASEVFYKLRGVKTIDFSEQVFSVAEVQQSQTGAKARAIQHKCVGENHKPV
jgi:hypothetical protein